MAYYKFLRGNSANLASVTVEDGAFYLTTDTHQLFVGQGEEIVPVNEGVVTVADIASLPESAITGSFYYATKENVLCVFNGQTFVQINPDTDTGATAVAIKEGSVGNVVVGAEYDEATRTINLIYGTVDLDAVKNDVYQVTSDSLDIDVLAEGITPKAGDVLIVTSNLKKDSDGNDIPNTNFKSAYSYDAEDGWVACDGNVSADKVILKDDITLAGNYTAVGNITKSNANATGTFATAGKSVSAALTEIFSKRLQPGNPTAPSVSFTTNITQDVEVGTSVTPTYAVKLNAGSYKYGPATGVTAKSWSVTDSDGNTALTTASGSFPSFIVQDNESYTITATATYDAGVKAKDNLGDEANPVVQIPAGSKSATSGKITGFRYMFFGSSASVDNDLTSSDIRALAVKKKSATGTFTESDGKGSLVVVEGAKHVVIAVPANRTVTKIADDGAFGTDILSEFSESTVNVNGASEGTETSYKVYEYKPSAALGANTYTVTVG